MQAVELYDSPSSTLPFAPLWLSTGNPTLRRRIISTIIESCTPSELLYISMAIAPLLKRDIIFSLPPELSIYILEFLDDPKAIVRVSQVSKYWQRLAHEECLWKHMCLKYHYDDWEGDDGRRRKKEELDVDDTPSDSFEQSQMASSSKVPIAVNVNYTTTDSPISFRQHFKNSYITATNWRKGGQLLNTHRLPIVTPDNGVITSIALDSDWVVVGLANSKIHVFNARTGVLARTLVGHDSGVWGVHLISKGGWRISGAQRTKKKSTSSDAHPEGSIPDNLHTPRHTRKTRFNRTLRAKIAELNIDDSCENDPKDLLPPSLQTALGLDTYSDDDDDSNDRCERINGWYTKPSSKSFASEGWGQPNALVISGGCDKFVRVWDIKSGQCIYKLSGHTSTIRCMRMLHNCPIAVTGSRDLTLRVWDVQLGKCLRSLVGHRDSVRCIDVCGNRAVSASYDSTCRLWDLDTGECLHELRGHFHQLYSVAFDGERIVTGGLDTTVRVWDTETGSCIALLQGHTALICQVQIFSTTLVTGGADGRVITFSLDTFKVLHRIAAHDSSVTSLQFNKNFIVTGGMDGRVRLFETETGAFVREWNDPSESVWKVAFTKDVCAIACKRGGKTVTEIWSLRPRKGQ